MLLILLLASLFLSACGGGGDGGGDAPPVVVTSTLISGTFIDSPVDGLHYASLPSNPAGSVTANGGQYQCQPGDTMTFNIAGRAIGNPQPCGPVVTALSVFGATSTTDQRVVNLSQLLLTLGGIPSGQNPIQLPATIPANLPNPLNFSGSNFDAVIQNALPAGTTLVSEAQAITHLQASFKTLSVTLVNSAAVTSNPVGINCTVGTCSSFFVTGTTITLTTTGTGFIGWSGAGCSGTGTCVVTLTADTAVTATFPVVPPPATLTILPNQGTGTGSVACSVNGGAFGPCAASYSSGTALVLQATANSGSAFAGWSDGTGNATVCNSTAADCSMNLNADSAVRATFVLNAITQFSVSGAPATANGGGGLVSCSANGGTAAPCGSYPVGTAMIVTATPNSASNFTGWSSGIGNATACNGTTGPCSFTLTANSSVTANFNLPVLSVVVVGTGAVTSSPSGIDCGATCTAAFNKDTSITLTAISAEFSGWSGASCSGTGTCVVTLNQSTAVTATFNGAGLPPFAQQAYLKASNTGSNDIFGYSVALSGDTLVVGAWQEGSSATGVNGDQTNNSAPASGAVYVFTRTGGVWTQQAYLKASNTDAGDNFGTSVALSGDTLAVGAEFEASNATGVDGDQTNNSAPASGAVYVFTRTGGVWTQQAYLKASNADAWDQFGFTVAIAGDTLAVTAPCEDSNATGINSDGGNNSATDSGAAYVFTRTGGIWTQQAYLKASNTDAGDNLGTVIVVAGHTLAVSASHEASNATGVNGNQADNSAPNSGAVYVFTRTGGVWTQQAYLKASNTDAGDRLGESLAVDGDTIVVGARLEASAASGVDADQTDNSAPNAGAVYVFSQTGGVWTQQAYLKASNAGAHTNFGGSVAIAGDIVAVGARLEDSNATGINGNQGNTNAPDSGAVYVFSRIDGIWTQETYIKASNTGANDEFGISVALSGDTLAVGARFEGSNAIGVNGNQVDNSAPNSGAVYVFSR